jgi:hypothetical protein
MLRKPGRKWLHDAEDDILELKGKRCRQSTNVKEADVLEDHKAKEDIEMKGGNEESEEGGEACKVKVAKRKGRHLEVSV